jgi:hypothetical protein
LLLLVVGCTASNAHRPPTTSPCSSCDRARRPLGQAGRTRTAEKVVGPVLQLRLRSRPRAAVSILLPPLSACGLSTTGAKETCPRYEGTPNGISFAGFDGGVHRAIQCRFSFRIIQDTKLHLKWHTQLRPKWHSQLLGLYSRYIGRRSPRQRGSGRALPFAASSSVAWGMGNDAGVPITAHHSPVQPIIARCSYSPLRL